MKLVNFQLVAKSEESTAFFKAYSKFSPNVKKIKKKEDLKALAEITKAMLELNKKVKGN